MANQTTLVPNFVRPLISKEIVSNCFIISLMTGNGYFEPHLHICHHYKETLHKSNMHVLHNKCLYFNFINKAFVEMCFLVLYDYTISLILPGDMKSLKY